ncbi:winged helix DNA-binding domain-containing protein [Conexibacter woesei]|uniref:winged helix DNA-binding domain-containing protein n=1 Tax=Conexibacter woesei TaxID=191495 RepID=UPI0003FA9506|nr:winged helix DNA-binding domain-containing protein [Conexibacter woesei]
MADLPPLDTLALNRALLARQWLLAPRRASALEAVEHLVGLQAQDARAPYLQLLPRLQGFDPLELSALLESHAAVRIVLMRGTIHLVSARDAYRLRPLVQPMIARATDNNHGVAAAAGAVARAGRALVEDRPRTFAQLAEQLGPRFPGDDATRLAQQVRAHVPLVQVPPRGLWLQGGAAAHTSLEAWCPDVSEHDHQLDMEDLILRYLNAFGPATVQDAQKWSGLTRLAPHFRALAEQGRAVTATDAQTGRRTLYDLPDAPRPDPGDSGRVAPILTGPFDNLILSHADGTRVLPAEHRPKVMTQNGLFAGLVLIDGFAAGNWRIEATNKQRATLTVARFTTKAYTKPDERAITRAAERLLQLAHPDARQHVVELTPPG